MARLEKQGLDYFPMDVDFQNDIKVRKILHACGTGSISVLLYLLCNIYKDYGYYMRWDEDDCFLIADQLVGIKEVAVQEIVNKALQVGFFDKDKFDKFKILTSNGIQKRFLSACARRKKIVFDYRYGINVDINSINDNINVINVGRSTQKKGKEKKGNTTTNVVESEDELPTHPKIDYKALVSHFNKKFSGILPQVMQITEKRRKAVKARIGEYSKNDVLKVFEKVFESSFLRGNNNRSWRADFDWIFRPSNFTKILEGGFDNNSKSKENEGQQERDDEFTKYYNDKFKKGCSD